MNLAENICNRFNQLKNETERSNFENNWQAQAEYCSPTNNNVNTVRTAGERKSSERLIDIGIRSNRIFTSGLSSHLVPAGARFFTYGTGDPRLKRNDAVSRYFADVTEITYDILNSSNFFQEFTKCLNQLGFIGTSCIIAEPASVGNVINFKAHYINEYYIAEDAFGKVDTVYFELKMTARQVYQLFGDQCSERILNDATDPKKSDNPYTIIHAIEPRHDFIKDSLKADERPIKSTYVELESKHVLKNSGYYEMPYAVGRFYQSTNEKYGRSPADECIATLSMVNAMEKTRLQAAQRASNPPWLSPNDGSVRRISNQSGSIIYWNAGNPASKPEQLSVKDNVMVNDQMIQVKNEEIEDAFFMPLFDPLINRQNMTATESQLRANIALQNLVPAIGRLTTELLNPLFKRIYFILQRQGMFPPMPPELDGDIQVGFNSKATQAIKQLEIAGIYQTLENVTFLSQFDPSILDNFNMDEVARKTAEANSVPTDVLNSEIEVEKTRAERAQQAAEERQQEQLSAGADAYNKTSQAPEAGSGAQALMAEAGL